MQDAVRKVKRTNAIFKIDEKWRKSLSAKLFILTVLSVLLAEAFVMVPSVSNQRIDLLTTRIEAAYLVSLALEAPEGEMIERETAEQLFATANIVGVNVDRGDARYRIYYAPDLPEERRQPRHRVNLTANMPITMIAGAWGTLFSKGDDLVLVMGKPARVEGEMVDILVSQRALRQELWDYTLTILGLSAFISTMTAALIYTALNRLIVKPVKQLTRTMAAFEKDPEGRKTFITLTDRMDEIGDAERGLHAVVTRIQTLLAEQRRLAALGAGISKISHDLRNILASAQLMSDRLAKSDDPRVRKLSPRLISSLDRAISLSNDTLSYGRMGPHALKRSTLNLSDLVDEVFDDTASLHVRFDNRVAADLLVNADRTHLYRAIFNLVRNAVEALDAPAVDAPSDDVERCVAVKSAIRGDVVALDIIDNGPGLPASARAHLFEPFKGSNRPGGSGLGVAIAHEIMSAHGGDLILLKSDEAGVTFQLTLPGAENPSAAKTTRARASSAA